MERTEHTLDRASALKMIRNAPGGARFFVTAHLELPIDGDDGKCFRTCQGIKVSRNEALKFIDGALSETLSERGGRIRIRTSPSASSLLVRSYYHIG
ncbi:hypothetical protein [Paraburkholderia phosphatilytica]|uniref:hypothetical protein n=1 Tax=Paraburkholderia phosphatilytica TaxID=2282883 RepID=UPI000F5F8300|nr:hypothetical protein [Paraburkholderia phosphatilytica]